MLNFKLAGLAASASFLIGTPLICILASPHSGRVLNGLERIILVNFQNEGNSGNIDCHFSHVWHEKLILYWRKLVKHTIVVPF
jgi:hypothetical protein